jgi:hypothetical protein
LSGIDRVMADAKLSGVLLEMQEWLIATPEWSGDEERVSMIDRGALPRILSLVLLIAAMAVAGCGAGQRRTPNRHLWVRRRLPTQQRSPPLARHPAGWRSPVRFRSESLMKVLQLTR